MDGNILTDTEYTKLVDKLSMKYLGKTYQTKSGEVVQIYKLYIQNRKDTRKLDQFASKDGKIYLLTDLKKRVKNKI